METLHADYSDKEYWETFYVRWHKEHPGDYFEWFCRFDDIRDIFCNALNESFGSPPSPSLARTLKANILETHTKEGKKLQVIVKPSVRNIPILEVGCGLSDFAPKLVLNCGFTNIACIDYSQLALNMVEELNATVYKKNEEHFAKIKKCIKYSQADARFMPFENRSFTVRYRLFTPRC